ncbi:9762_t:CDS:2 [Acaulospora morrowiae]|uniref:9762_t:CDS:1 n=1 Tax=Acaulospora morrowiae TaxID=94023 RepID=A0A9N9C9Z6_9GLOM|nr:9762_t:CDS:2 [Acaulospora morrowiae]
MRKRLSNLEKWWMAAQEEQKEKEQKNKEEEEQQTQYQNTEEINIEEEEIPLTTYKTINDEVVERQNKLEKQIEQMGRILTKLLENDQAAITKKKQQSQGQ